jgi:hypothetical protein
MLPPFNHEGLLPPGDHRLSLDDLRRSLLVVGPGEHYPNWDRAWRGRLVDNLGLLVPQLCHVGVKEIFIGGSFAEDVDHPNDIDGDFVCDLDEYLSRKLERKLDRNSPHPLLWRWDDKHRRPDHHGIRHIPMWHLYQIELWPAPLGQMSGIVDRSGNMFPWTEAFRHSRSRSRRWKPRGMIKIEATP